MFAAVMHDAVLDDAGQAEADGDAVGDRVLRRCSATMRRIVAATASGVDGRGVLTRTRLLSSSPVAMSISAALMPVPPKSMPSPSALSSATNAG